MINSSLLFQLSRLNLKWLFIYHLNYKNINNLSTLILYNIILKDLGIIFKVQNWILYKFTWFINNVD